MKKTDKRNRLLLGVVGIIVLLLIIIIIYLLLYKKETHNTESYEDGKTSALICTSEDNDTAFFSSETAISVKHTVKIVYKNEKLEKLAYEYEGKYKTEGEAKYDSGKLLTKFNIYSGEHNINREMLTPVFQHAENKALIRLFLDDYQKMTASLGTIFYIGNGMIETIGRYSAEETKSIYENKGFSCIINND